MDYALLKTVHQAAVVLSITGFVARGTGAMAGADWVRSRAAKSLPHVVDSVLLLSALGMAWVASFNPLATPWLLAKIVALLVYIGLGMVALKAGRPPALRVAAGVAAVFTVGYIVSVAVTKSPRGFL